MLSLQNFSLMYFMLESFIYHHTVFWNKNFTLNLKYFVCLEFVRLSLNFFWTYYNYSTNNY